MKNQLTLSLVILAACALYGCGKSSDESPPQHQDRRAPGETAVSTTTLAPAPSTAGIENPAMPESFEELVQRATTLEPIVERLRAAIDRTHFDPTELNASRQFKPEALASFVKEEVFFEQYPGILRGAIGTLIGRAGNALDQSLLLGQLLEEAGLEWRIAHAILSQEDAARLVSQMEHARPELPPAGDETVIREILREMYATLGFSDAGRDQLTKSDQKSDQKFFEATTEGDTRFILDALEQAGLRIGDSAAMTALIEEARDYYWIEYRVDAYNEWTAVHPAFQSERVPTVTASESFTAPPEDLYHRVRFEVFVEQKLKDELIVKPIVATERTTASLIGAPITFRNYPDNFGAETAADPDAMMKGVSVFLPVLNGELEGNAFDLDGIAFGVGLTGLDQVGLTEVFQRQAQQVERGIGGLDALGEPEAAAQNPDDIFTLTAQWMEYAVIQPGGAQQISRRYMFDRVGVANREAGVAEITDPTELTEAAQALLTTTTLTVVSNRLSPAYVLDRFGERMAREIELIEAASTVTDLESLPTAQLDRLVPPEDFLLAAAFDSGHQMLADHLSYRSEPTVAVYQQGDFERVDIVNHTRRHFDISDALQFSPSAAIKAGVWESYAERAPIRTDEDVIDTATAFRESQSEGIGVHVLTPDDIDLVEDLSHSTMTKHNLRGILLGGDAVVFPQRPLANQDDVHWWRIDTMTGETLGMSTGGYGATYAEMTVLLKSSIILASFNFGACMGGRDSVSVRGTACCFVVGGVVFATGYGLRTLSIARGGSGVAGLGAGLMAGPGGMGVGRMCTDENLRRLDEVLQLPPVGLGDDTLGGE